MGQLLAKINVFILNPIIILGFVIAVLVFFWGIVKFISSADNDTAREEGKRSILFGVVGLFIMFSVFGIMNFLLDTFNFPKDKIDVLK